MKTMQTTADYGEMLHTMDELISTYGSDFGGIDAEAQEAKNLITEMAKDVIVIPPEPTDFALMNKGKYFEEMQVPAWLNEGIQQGYKFYFMRFPLDIQAKKQSFNTVEFKMRFEDAGNKGNLFFYKFFPNDEVKKYLEGGISGKVT
ncbi:MAG TPA: hypothetical protein PL045_06170, partial [Chitinophagaceae bacterium]|nr:hypothetical protein [Chitinophagaceae bacterium]